MRKLTLRNLFFLLALVNIAAIYCLTPAFGWEVVDEHTLALWTLDEGDGTVVSDLSGNENHGDIVDAEWVDGMAGAALFFDGESSQVIVPDSATLHPETGDITIEAWIKVASDPLGWGPGTSAAGAIVYKGSAYQWAVHGELSGTLWLGIWGGRLESTGNYLFSDHVDEWRHVTTTYDSSSQEAKIYVDGELNSEGNIAAAIDVSTQPVYLGYKGDDSVYFHGIIDQVRVSDTVRSEEEIREMMDLDLAVRPVDKLPVLWGALKYMGL